MSIASSSIAGEPASAPVVAATAPGVAAAAAADAASGGRGLGPMVSAIDALTNGAPLGETEVGKAWCLKALHPADTSVLSSPMPTYETRSIASVAFQQLDLLTMPSGEAWDPTKTWNCTIWLHRDPCFLASYRIEQPGLRFANGILFSKQIGGATTYPLAYQALRTNCEKFRMTSQSITCYFDAASQSDQGHIVCAQTELPRVCAPSWREAGPIHDNAVSMATTFYQDPVPTYEQMLQTSRAYQGKAAEGVYCPSKMLNIGQWIFTNQAYKLIGSSPATPPGGGVMPFNLYSQTQFEADEPLANFANTFPYSGVQMVFAQADTGLTTIYITGIAPTSSLRLTTRWTLDLTVRPGTVYAPFTKTPPTADYSALRMYTEVSRRMPDGHPSRYNNLGAILGVIGKIAAQLAPAIIPKLGEFVGRRIAERRNAGKASALELLNPMTGAQYHRMNDLYDRRDRLTPEELAEYTQLQPSLMQTRTSPYDLLGGIPGALFRAAKGYRGGYRRKGYSKKKGTTKKGAKRTKKQSTTRAKRPRAYTADEMSE